MWIICFLFLEGFAFVAKQFSKEIQTTKFTWDASASYSALVLYCSRVVLVLLFRQSFDVVPLLSCGASMFFPCCSCTVPMVLQVFLTCPQGLIGKKRGAVYDIENLMVVTLVNDDLWFRVLPRWRFSSDLFMKSEKNVFSLTRCVSKFRCSFAVSLHWSLGTPPLPSLGVLQ